LGLACDSTLGNYVASAGNEYSDFLIPMIKQDERSVSITVSEKVLIGGANNNILCAITIRGGATIPAYTMSLINIKLFEIGDGVPARTMNSQLQSDPPTAE
jgi:hypothetical protein